MQRRWIFTIKCFVFSSAFFLLCSSQKTHFLPSVWHRILYIYTHIHFMSNNTNSVDQECHAYFDNSFFFIIFEGTLIIVQVILGSDGIQPEKKKNYFVKSMHFHCNEKALLPFCSLGKYRVFLSCFSNLLGSMGHTFQFFAPFHFSSRMQL